MKKLITVIEPYRQRGHLQRNGRSHALLSGLLHCFPECAQPRRTRPDVPVPSWRHVFIDSGRCSLAVGGEFVVRWFRGLDVAGIAFGDTAHSGFGLHPAGEKLSQCSLSAGRRSSARIHEKSANHRPALHFPWHSVAPSCLEHQRPDSACRSIPGKPILLQAARTKMNSMATSTFMVSPGGMYVRWTNAIRDWRRYMAPIFRKMLVLLTRTQL